MCLICMVMHSRSLIKLLLEGVQLDHGWLYHCKGLKSDELTGTLYDDSK